MAPAVITRLTKYRILFLWVPLGYEGLQLGGTTRWHLLSLALFWNLLSAAVRLREEKYNHYHQSQSAHIKVGLHVLRSRLKWSELKISRCWVTNNLLLWNDFEFISVTQTNCAVDHFTLFFNSPIQTSLKLRAQPPLSSVVWGAGE